MRVTTDEIEKAKEIPLIDFIDANGIDVKSEGKGYRLVEHDSLVITGNKFYWNSRDDGGYGSISFAMKYYDLKFPDAVKRVNEHEYSELTNVQEDENKPFKYPYYFEVDDTKEIKDYLSNERKLDNRVVEWCIDKDLLVQDKKQNAVFKWKDNKGHIIGGDRQGTKPLDNKRGTFKNIMPSSKDDGGFTINVGKKPDKIAVFESPIDMLSYWSIKKEKVQDTKLVSMSGLKTRTLAKAMNDMKQEGHEIKKVISCVDNDKAGKEFHDKLARLFKKDVLVDGRPQHSKDWNDELKNAFNKNQKHTKEQAYGM